MRTFVIFSHHKTYGSILLIRKGDNGRDLCNALKADHPYLEPVAFEDLDSGFPEVATMGLEFLRRGSMN